MWENEAGAENASPQACAQQRFGKEIITIYENIFVKYCYSESNTFLHSARNPVVWFYFLTFLAMFAFSYLFFWT